MSDFNNGNNNTNSFQPNRVTTSGMTLFDENGIMLRMSYLDDSLSFIIGESVVNDMGKRTYPQDKRHPFIITMDRAAVLYDEIIMKKVLSAIENNQNYNGGVFLNRRKDSIFEIRVQNGEVYLCFYKGINEDRVPAESYIFKCQKSPIIEGYSADGSTDFAQEEVQSFFLLFCKYLDAGIYDVHNSSAHSFRRNSNSIFNYLKGIAAKLGVSLEHRNQSTSGFMNVTETENEELPFNDYSSESTSLDGLL